MRKTELFYTSILAPFDYLLLILSGIIVYYLRFRALVELRPVIYQLQFLKYLSLILIISAVWLGIFSLIGLYNLAEKRQLSKEISRIFIGCSAGTMVVILFIFFSQELFSSRFIILANWLVAIIFLSFGHFFINLIKISSYKKGKGLEPVLIFGEGEETERMVRSLKNKSEFGYQVLGSYSSSEQLIEDWQNKAYEISQIIQTNHHLSEEENSKLVEFCNEHQIVFKYTTNLFGALSNNMRIEILAGLPIIEIQRTGLQGWGKIYKRVFDLIFSLMALVFLSPLFFYLALIIKLDSKGPVLIGLVRAGERGKNFKLYKFRSMIKNAEKIKKDLLQLNEREDGILFKMKNDPRITKIGKFLRRMSIDELPQLFNIIKGEMSLVGPRPHEPAEVGKYQKHHKQLLTIKPGLTGLAQISGRSDLSFEEEAKLDIHYIENWLMSLDLQILIRTIKVILSQKNVA